MDIERIFQAGSLRGVICLIRSSSRNPEIL